MIHKEIPPFEKANPRFDAVRKALDENDRLLEQTKYKVAHNTNKVLRYLVETIYRVETDLILLQRKLQPILKHLENDDDNWRRYMPRDENE